MLIQAKEFKDVRVLFVRDGKMVQEMGRQFGASVVIQQLHKTMVEKELIHKVKISF